MSRETKLGLLISLGVILAFALLIGVRFSHEQYADMGSNSGGTHLAQYEELIRIGQGDPLDRELRSVRGGDSDREDIVRPVVEPGGDAQVAGDDGTTRRETGQPDDDENRVVMVIGVGEGSITPADVARETVTPEEPGERTTGDVVPTEAVLHRYTVRRGDTLFTIAEKFFGPAHGAKWPRIASANPGVDPNRLRPGTVLVIPGIEQPEVRIVSTEGPARQPVAPDVYVVASGDTLGEISGKVYGTCKKWQVIQEANRNINPLSLRVGQKLVIPREGGSAVARSGGDLESEQAVETALDEVRRFVADGGQSRTPHSMVTVSRGDTLWAISRRQLGTSDRWKEIFELNRDTLKRPNDVRAGQVLRVPATTQTAMVETTDVR